MSLPRVHFFHPTSRAVIGEILTGHYNGWIMQRNANSYLVLRTHRPMWAVEKTSLTWLHMWFLERVHEEGWKWACGIFLANFILLFNSFLRNRWANADTCEQQWTDNKNLAIKMYQPVTCFMNCEIIFLKIYRPAQKICKRCDSCYYLYTQTKIYEMGSDKFMRY